MTEKELRAKIVNKAKGYIGTVEGDSNHKHILSVYNSHTPLARGYKVQSKDAWCATFVSFVFIEAGMPNLIVTECGCEEMINKNKGIWQEMDEYTPEAGDIIMYDWQDTGSGDNKGYADHVGIVEKVEGNAITVIEGNYSDSVKRRKINLNGRYIRGFITPKYYSIATSEASSSSASHSASSGQLSTTPKWQGKVTASALNVRTGPGTGYSIFSPLENIPNGKKVDVCDEKNGWCYIRITKSYGDIGSMAQYYAWVSGKYIKKV